MTGLFVAACGIDDGVQHDSNSSETGSPSSQDTTAALETTLDGDSGIGDDLRVNDPFSVMAISEMNAIRKLMLWRIGRHAEGPGRTSDEPSAALADANDFSWSFSVGGDGLFTGNALGLAAGASEAEAKRAFVALVEEATNADVTADWSELNADTWSAKVNLP